MNPDAPERYRTLLIFGAPGSGKGTQGRIIGNIPRFHYFSCGDAFRALDMRSPIGKKFMEYSSKGELVPDELTVELWKNRIDIHISSSLFKPDIDLLLLDGIPRNVHQAELLAPHIDVQGVLHLSCPNRTELARRIRKRALKENRFDDANEEVIKQRFKTYEDESRPILEHYGHDLVHQLDATQPPMKVLSDILHIVMDLPAWKDISKQVV